MIPGCEIDVSKEIAGRKELSETLNDPFYADFTILCGESAWKVSRAVVCSASGFFRGAWENDMQEKLNGQVELEETDERHVAAMLRFLYKGCYYNNPLTVSEGDHSRELAFHVAMYCIADRYRIQDMMTHAIAHLSRTSSNHCYRQTVTALGRFGNIETATLSDEGNKFFQEFATAVRLNDATIPQGPSNRMTKQLAKQARWYMAREKRREGLAELLLEIDGFGKVVLNDLSSNPLHKDVIITMNKFCCDYNIKHEFYHTNLVGRYCEAGSSLCPICVREGSEHELREAL
ncbi:MAG: hypothetical protein M1828_004101 [Chrysothrix sp. TS-e1954]|nr:MAG: hypothetical protein M1828_004101 [Chrysothrix sp. TS-e1954]